MADFKNDQAAGLRRIMATPIPRVVSIISAASISASPTHDQPRMMTNLAACIRSQGSEVLILHASYTSSAASYEINQQPTLFDVANFRKCRVNFIFILSYFLNVYDQRGCFYINGSNCIKLYKNSIRI